MVTTPHCCANDDLVAPEEQSKIKPQLGVWGIEYLLRLKNYDEDKEELRMGSTLQQEPQWSLCRHLRKSGGAIQLGMLLG